MSLVKRDSSRNGLKRCLTASKKAESLDQPDIESYLVILGDHWSNFLLAQEAVELSCGEDTIQDQESEREQGEQWYRVALANFNRALAKVRTNIEPHNENAPAPTRANIKLPPLGLPKFSGEAKDWRPFHDAFVSVVHSVDTLSGAQKLQYLRCSLADSARALQIINGLPITNNNYQEAWSLLKKRYDVQRVLIDAHFRALFSLKKLNNESSSALRHLVDTIQEHFQSLKALGRPVTNWDDWLVHLTVSKLDAETHRQWELSFTEDTVPKFDDLVTFLEKRCRSLDAIDSYQKPAAFKATPQRGKPNKPFSSLLASSAAQEQNQNTPAKSSADSCSVCSSNHKIFACDKFRAFDVKKRIGFVKDNKLCTNCLGSGHLDEKCRSANTCRTCRIRHHSLLHDDSPSTSSKIPSNYSQSYCSISEHQVLLGTAIVDILDNSGRYQPARVLFDNGSHLSFITENCMRRLKLKRSPKTTMIQGIGATTAGSSKGEVQLQVSSTDHSFSTTIIAQVLPKLTNMLPPVHICRQNWSHLMSLNLADPHFGTPASIDILVGADELGQFLCTGLIKGPTGTPMAQQSTLGWILFGKIHNSATVDTTILPATLASTVSPATMTTTASSAFSTTAVAASETAISASTAKTPSMNTSTALNSAVCLFCNTALTKAVTKFWQIEALPEIKHLSIEELTCEKIFEKTHYRQEDGRYVVRLPFKSDCPLGNSRNAAIRALQRMEALFLKDESLKDQYRNFIQEFIDLGHMEKVNHQAVPGKHYYMPHRAVFKETSTTTKLRVVFNASCRTTTGFSLNDTQMVGPQLQPELYLALIRMRTYRFAMSADVTKMYRQVRMHKEHIDYQRIVWRNSPKDDIEEYRILTVTYGVASSSHLAVKSLQQVALDEGQNSPAAANAIMNHFYMDDLLTGCHEEEDLQRLQVDVSTILAKGGFSLRKWSSNSALVINSLPDHHRELLQPLDLSDADGVRTLGLQWDPSFDKLSFSVKTFEVRTSKLTKRLLLSEATKLFDPLGLLAPTTIIPKMLFQRLWQPRVDWDEAVPQDVNRQWLHYTEHIAELAKIKIPRWVGLGIPNATSDLHGFADASQNAYAAALYIRTVTSNGDITVQLLTAKTRVAPLKTTTLSLPRLELCAAALLAKLVSTIQPTLGTNIRHVFGWTDSTICLAWIRQFPGKWCTFVANRVSQIQQVIPPEN
ncbi:uncharacterized protein LOC129919682 [Episyrphus balteatus]|uniref:uncharacterized protein LOC129919682 n=1 Tax=Episyrphus balteatus TaxID=286459 RepID=UPI0024852A57|nr:uncharacterized protein LOC129919682 [Episyrphus balteatus]